MRGSIVVPTVVLWQKMISKRIKKCFQDSTLAVPSHFAHYLSGLNAGVEILR